MACGDRKEFDSAVDIAEPPERSQMEMYRSSIRYSYTDQQHNDVKGTGGKDCDAWVLKQYYVRSRASLNFAHVHVRAFMGILSEIGNQNLTNKELLLALKQ